MQQRRLAQALVGVHRCLDPQQPLTHAHLVVHICEYCFGFFCEGGRLWDRLPKSQRSEHSGSGHGRKAAVGGRHKSVLTDGGSQYDSQECCQRCRRACGHDVPASPGAQPCQACAVRRSRDVRDRQPCRARVRVRSDTLVQHCLCCVSHWPHAAISLAAGAHGCLKRCREQ